MNLEFDEPEKLSVGGKATVNVGIDNVSAIKSAETSKSLNEDSFEGGKPDLGGGLPPIETDPEQTRKIETGTEGATDFVTFTSSSNFLIAVFLGGTMQTLWGMIRALQLISLSALIQVALPNHMHVFLTICIHFSQMDILNAEDMIG